MASLRRPSQFIPSNKAPVFDQKPKEHVPSPLAGGSGGRGGERKKEARKSKVGDAIKRRMSMRYAGPEQLFGGQAPMPGVTSSFLDGDPYGGLAAQPTIREEDEDEEDTSYALPPSQGRSRAQGQQQQVPPDGGESKFGQFSSPAFSFGERNALGTLPGKRNVSGDEGIRRRGAVDMAPEEEWDLEEMGKEGFDLAGFMKKTLTGADNEERKRFRAALERLKQQNAKELQRNVFKNYAEFVHISKEISTLENDMLELKELLSQWKDLPQLMGMDDTLAPTLDRSGNIERKRTQRNSILDLQQLYKQQLTTLWSTVEGSQKYLPLVPGRHLVFETHNFVELNAATYKAKQSVSLFLLSDLLLIAGRRRTKTGASPQIGSGDAEKGRERGRMVAERCWVLADLVVIDVKDSGDLTNALKIRRGKEVCVYRTNKSEDKKALLAAFRQVSQELSEKKRKDSEKEQERRRSMWQGDGGHGGIAGDRSSLLQPNRPLSVLGGSLSDSKDLRWIEDFGDELTMAIATRDWEEAVGQIEKGEELLKIAAPNADAVSLLSTRLTHLRPTLISQLASDLAFPEIRKHQVLRLVGLLSRLDQDQLARNSFLGARREAMLKRVRAIRAEGDIGLYISELAVVCFTVVRNTGDWYMSAFKENKMASGFVNWAKTQIEYFADMFRRQVYAPNVDHETAEECMKVTASHNRKLLRDVGLDFTFLLSSLLQPPSSSSHALPTFSFPTTTPAPKAAYHIESSPFSGYTIPETPSTSLFGRSVGPPRAAMSEHDEGGPSPSDVLEDYSYGYNDDEDMGPDAPPPSSARSRGGTAPLNIAPKSPRKRGGGEGTPQMMTRSPSGQEGRARGIDEDEDGSLR